MDSAHRVGYRVRSLYVVACARASWRQIPLCGRAEHCSPTEHDLLRNLLISVYKDPATLQFMELPSFEFFRDLSLAALTSILQKLP